MNNKDIMAHCRLDTQSEAVLATAVEKLVVSARATQRILKIARTIADLEQREQISVADIFETIAYRRHLCFLCP